MAPWRAETAHECMLPIPHTVLIHKAKTGFFTFSLGLLPGLIINRSLSESRRTYDHHSLTFPEKLKTESLFHLNDFKGSPIDQNTFYSRVDSLATPQMAPARDILHDASGQRAFKTEMHMVCQHGLNAFFPVHILHKLLCGRIEALGHSQIFLIGHLHSAAAALPMLAAFVFSSGLLCVEAVLIRHHHAAFLRPDFPSVVTA